jgi:hypothetical protein
MPQEISYIKQDLAYATVLDEVTTTGAAQAHEAATRQAVVGEKAILKLVKSERHILATFASDGTPAAYKNTHGSGRVFVAAYPVGLAYFYPAMPKRPPARGNTDLTFNHWIPTEFDVSARELLALAVDGVIGARPVLTSAALVDIGVIAAAGKGIAVVLTNWSPDPVATLNITLDFDAAGSKVSMASGEPVREDKTVGGRRCFELRLGVADCLILRP